MRQTTDMPHPRRIPGRRAPYLLFYNHFQYLALLPILANIFFLEAEPRISAVLSLLAILGVAIFWNASRLDVSMGAQDHPHHQRWSLYYRVLTPFARLIQGRPPWQLSLLGTVLISIPILIIARPFFSAQSLTDLPPRLAVELYWLTYVPFLMWSSHHTHRHSSERFLFLWVLAVMLYSVCYWLVLPGRRLDSPIQFGLVLIWFFFISALIHYLLRRMAILREQAELVKDVTERLRDDRRYTEAFDLRPIPVSSDKSLNQIAEQIGTTLLYDWVFILVHDSKRSELVMKGRYGTGAPWPKVGWSTTENQSITGWVALNKEPHLCANTGKCSLFFNPDNAYPCLSEAAVPILVEGECVGVIDIESPHSNAFGQSDIRLLSQIANSIGASLSYERHISKEVDKAHRLLVQASEILIQSKNLDDALQKVAQRIREIFSADLIVLYKHAVGTCIPLPGLILDGTPIYPKLLGHSIREESRLNDLLRKTRKIYVQPNADEDPVLLGPNNGYYSPDDARLFGNEHRFVRREKIKSMVYIKLGLGNEIVGSLFLNYRRSMNFQPKMIESLQAFANVLTMGLILKRQLERAEGPLAGTIPLAHSTAEAAFESVSRDFDEIDWKQIRNTAENQPILKQIRTYRRKLEELRTEWKNLILVEPVNLDRSSIVEPIAQLESKLHSMFPNANFKWDSRQFLDVPTDELGEVIYKVIAEGVSNALVHAHADHIRVQCKKNNKNIHILVTNNGKRMDAATADRLNNLGMDRETGPEKQTGIQPILLDSRRWFGAEWNFSTNSVNNTVLTIIFPLDMDEEEEFPNEDEP